MMGSRVLVVEDVRSSREIVAQHLRRGGHDVVETEDGEQGLAAARAQDPDLVLTDLVMPGVDGSKLIRGIKHLSPETPAILLSGKVKIYEQETNADVFLSKGMDIPADLLERIRVLLIRKRGPKRSQARAQAPPAPCSLPSNIASA